MLSVINFLTFLKGPLAPTLTDCSTRKGSTRAGSTKNCFNCLFKVRVDSFPLQNVNPLYCSPILVNLSKLDSLKISNFLYALFCRISKTKIVAIQDDRLKTLL